jgi:hypothetical protein
MWSDVDTRVLMFRVKSSSRSIFGTDNVAGMTELRSKLREVAAAKLEGGKPQFGEFMNSLNDSELVVFARIAAITGALKQLEAMRARLPGILDVRDQFGMTPMAWACAFGQEVLLDFARSCGANMSSINSYCWSFCDLAKANGHRAMVTKLIGMGSAEPGITLRNRMRACGIALDSEERAKIGGQEGEGN